MRAFAHDLLGFFRLLPERRILGERVQLVETTKRVVPVKDASSAEKARSESRPPSARSQRASGYFLKSKSGGKMLESRDGVNAAPVSSIETL
jgi:hypothetical protein